MAICTFCDKNAVGKIKLNNWSFDTCRSNDCKRKETIIFKILIGDLSSETILKMARVIQE